MFAYCPFAFVRQAHSQLLLIGFLPWAMLAFHRFIDRVRACRARSSWAWCCGSPAWPAPTTASSPAAWWRSATIFLGVTPRLLEAAALLGHGGARRRGLHRADRAVLPALYPDAGVHRLRSARSTVVLGEPRRVADFLVVGAPVVGAVSLANPSEGVVSRDHRDRPRRVGARYCRSNVSIRLKPDATASALRLR